MSRLTKFRSFGSSRGQETNLPIWQVARAAISYPGLFPAIKIGPRLAPVTYISGEIGWSNPSIELIREFEAEWKGQGILCFASIGTGHQSIIRVDTSNMSDALDPAFEKMATDSQRVAEEIAHRFKGQHNYFRLSVEQGFQRNEDHRTLQLEDVIVHTKAYLGSTWVDTSVDRLVNSLLQAVELFPWQTTRENFEQMMEKYISNARICIGSIAINVIKEGLNEAVSILELIRVRAYCQRMTGANVG